MRKSTFIVDIDGCVLTHAQSDLSAQLNARHLLPNVKAQFNAWEKGGHCIILMTARPECWRLETEVTLRSLGLFWDQLIMGVTNGTRVLINDGPVLAIHQQRNGTFLTDAEVYGDPHVEN